MRKRGFYSRFAIDGMRKNLRAYLPYLLSSVLMVAMFYIVFALSQNSQIGGTTSAILMMGTVIIAIFAAIFLSYTNKFLIRQRKREFGLYNVLGLEKRHIARILLVETFVLAVASIFFGMLLGIILNKLAYLALMRLTNGIIQLGFELAPQVLVTTSVAFAILYVLLYLNSLRQLHRATAIQLLRSGAEGEKEPRSKWTLAIIGLICLLGGYAISLTTKEVGMAVTLFLVAVLLVIIGTYCLFSAGSIVFLKGLRRRKKYYYQTHHFITVSGMLYRMKQNAASLATICILSTMVLVTISATLALYRGCDDVVQERYPRDVSLEVMVPGDVIVDAAEPELTLLDDLAEEAQVQKENALKFSYLRLQSMEQGANFAVENINDGDFDSSMSILLEGNSCILFFLTAEDFQSLGGQAMTLSSDQVLLVTGNGSMGTYEYETMQLLGQTFQVAGCLNDMPQSNVFSAVSNRSWFVIVSDSSVLQTLHEAHPSDYSLRVFYGFDTPEPADGPALVAAYRQAREEQQAGSNTLTDPTIYAREAERPDYYALYGALFFIGILLSVTFLVAAILIIYYKQVSEGFQDQHRYQIMAQVGLDHADVKRSIRSQILTMFFLPLLAAGIHSAFAVPILFNILRALAVSQMSTVVVSLAGSFFSFALVYVVVYILTARTYYRIVSAGR